MTRRGLGRAVLGILIAVELIAGGGVLYVNSLDSTTPLAVDEAVQRFREMGRPGSTTSSTDRPTTTTAAPHGSDARTVEPTNPTATTEDAPGEEMAAGASSRDGAVEPGAAEPSLRLPEPGVYVYDTTGHETIDAFGGARHDYPSETAVTVTEDGCGTRSRWEPIAERWDEWSTCPGDEGAEWTAFATHHEFFGQSEEHHFECGPAATMRPLDTTPGSAWTYRCEDAASWFENRVEVVGVETLDVGGTAVETVHVHIDSVLGGDTRGTATFDYWFDLERSLEVRVIEVLDTESDSPFGVGTIDYHEEFDLRLRSLEPRQ